MRAHPQDRAKTPSREEVEAAFRRAFEMVHANPEDPDRDGCHLLFERLGDRPGVPDYLTFGSVSEEKDLEYRHFSDSKAALAHLYPEMEFTRAVEGKSPAEGYVLGAVVLRGWVASCSGRTPKEDQAVVLLGLYFLGIATLADLVRIGNQANNDYFFRQRWEFGEMLRPVCDTPQRLPWKRA